MIWSLAACDYEGLQRSHIVSHGHSDVTSTASLHSKIVSQHDQFSIKEHACINGSRIGATTNHFIHSHQSISPRWCFLSTLCNVNSSIEIVYFLESWSNVDSRFWLKTSTVSLCGAIFEHIVHILIRVHEDVNFRWQINAWSTIVRDNQNANSNMLLWFVP